MCHFFLFLATQPEDSGVWACRIIRDGEEYMTTEVDVVVLGNLNY